MSNSYVLNKTNDHIDVEDTKKQYMKRKIDFLVQKSKSDLHLQANNYRRSESYVGDSKFKANRLNEIAIVDD